MNSPTRCSGWTCEKPLRPLSAPRRPSVGWSPPAKLFFRLATFSFVSGWVGEPARDRSDGVAGPEYSAFVMGRGPDAWDERRDNEPADAGYIGRGAWMLPAIEGRLDGCGDAKGDDTGDSCTADSSIGGDMVVEEKGEEEFDAAWDDEEDAVAVSVADADEQDQEDAVVQQWNSRTGYNLRGPREGP